MYNRYIHSGGRVEPFRPLENTLDAHRRREGGAPLPSAPERHEAAQVESRKKKGGLSHLLKNFHIDWDMGDILLILILLLLYIDGEDEEILLVLGLVLFMGF